MTAHEIAQPEGNRSTAIALAHWILLTLAQDGTFSWRPILADLAGDPSAWKSFSQMEAWLQKRLEADPDCARRLRELNTPKMTATVLRRAATMAQLGITALMDSDSVYPPRLSELAHRADLRQAPGFTPPQVLYVRGSTDALSNDRAVAIVGTRQPTESGLAHAQALAEVLAGHGYTIVSGLAIGIDAAAHRGALAAKGCTIAVLATPLANVYPKVHQELAETIVHQGGALVSEWPVGWRTAAWHFPLRNRIQSGMSQAVIVVETRAKGGTIHTVQAAIAQRRLVLVPSPVVFGDTQWGSDEPDHPRSGLPAIVRRYRSTGLVRTYDGADELLRSLEKFSERRGAQQRLL